MKSLFLVCYGCKDKQNCLNQQPLLRNKQIRDRPQLTGGGGRPLLFQFSFLNLQPYSTNSYKNLEYSNEILMI